MPSQISSGRMSKQREIERRKRKKRKTRLIVILIITAIIGIILYLLNAPTFALFDVEITGNNQLNSEEVFAQSGLELGKSIFSNWNIVTKVRLKQNGYIEDAKVSKKLPNVIKIEIKERTKAFQLQTPNGFYIYIDEQGYIIDCKQESLDLKTIIGMDITEESVDKKKRLEDDDLTTKMENILHIKEETQKIEIFDKITKIQIKDNDYILELESDGIFINLGNCTNLKNRMYYVKTLLEKEAGNRGTINVSGNLNEGFAPYFTAE